MKANHLAVIFPAKDLPQNTVHACGAIWTRTSRMLLPGLGKLYDRFHPAAQPWGVEIPAPFSVVLPFPPVVPSGQGVSGGIHRLPCDRHAG